MTKSTGKIPFREKRNVRDRFMEKIELITESGCWIWTGSVDGNGYAQISHMGKVVHASYVSHILFTGPVPDGHDICHRCDVIECVNPAHLFSGTVTDNMLDSVKKGRHYWAKRTHCKNGHELTEDNVYKNKSHRICITCNRSRAKRQSLERSARKAGELMGAM